MHTHQNSPFAVVYGALYQRYQSSCVSVEQASDELSIHFTTARSWLSKGCFPVPSLTLGSRRVVPLAGLAAFVVRGSGLLSTAQDDDQHLASQAVEMAPKPAADQSEPAAAVRKVEGEAPPKRPRGRPRKSETASSFGKVARHG